MTLNLYSKNAYFYTFVYVQCDSPVSSVFVITWRNICFDFKKIVIVRWKRNVYLEILSWCSHTNCWEVYKCVRLHIIHCLVWISLCNSTRDSHPSLTVYKLDYTLSITCGHYHWHWVILNSSQCADIQKYNRSCV